MIDELEGGVTEAGAQGAAAIGIAMNEAARDGSAAAEARAFLREQTELSRLQKSTFEEEAKLNLSHLHFRRFGDFEARMQIATASHLDLMPSEKSELARAGAGHD